MHCPTLFEMAKVLLLFETKSPSKHKWVHKEKTKTVISSLKFLKHT